VKLRTLQPSYACVGRKSYSPPPLTPPPRTHTPLPPSLLPHANPCPVLLRPSVFSGAFRHDVCTCTCGCPESSYVVCAAAYAWGELGNNTCPENAVRIGSAEACQSAAIIMGKGRAGSEDLPHYPSGCYESVSGFFYYNAHPVGAGNPYARPLCAVGTSPPRTRTGPCATVQRTTRRMRWAPQSTYRRPVPLHHRRTDPSIPSCTSRAPHASRSRAAGSSCAAVWYPTALPQHRSSARRASLAQEAAAAVAARSRRQSRRYPMQQVRHCRTDPSLRMPRAAHPCLITQAGKHFFEGSILMVKLPQRHATSLERWPVRTH
jgi:hypothetical protein